MTQEDQLQANSEAIEDLLMGWLCLPCTATPEEERQSDIEMFYQLLCLAETVDLSGAITLTFTGGYLRTLDLCAPLKTNEGVSNDMTIP